MKKLSDSAPTWGPETLMDRLIACKFNLQLHGMLTNREAKIVERRLRKWAQRESAEREKTTKGRTA